ncbi:hypothetical protein ACFX2H_002004 [Malus domestica]
MGLRPEGRKWEGRLVLVCRERRPELLQLRSSENMGSRPRSRYKLEEQGERKRFLPSKDRDSVGGDRKKLPKSTVRRKTGVLTHNDSEANPT